MNRHDSMFLFATKYEEDLAAVDGMNPFAALVILSSKPLQEILDSAPNARLAEFGPLVGFHRMVSLADQRLPLFCDGLSGDLEWRA